MAAGTISLPFALGMALILFLGSFFLSYNYLNLTFLFFALGLFILTQLYSFLLKNILFADILTIAILFVLRAISGAFVINVKISPWLILCPFFLSLFLSVGKRHSDLLLLQNNAAQTRKVLQEYSLNLTGSLMNIFTTLLIVSYALYSFLSEHNYLLLTLPFALFVIFRYYYLIISNSPIARHPEKIFADKQMLCGIFLWLIITAYLIYK